MFVPEVLEVHVVPSGEVRMVPELPTAKNNGLDVVVVLSVVVLVSLLLLQEMTVRLKRDMRIMYKTLFIFSFTSIKWWGWFKGVILCMLHY